MPGTASRDSVSWIAWAVLGGQQHSVVALAGNGDGLMRLDRLVDEAVEIRSGLAGGVRLHAVLLEPFTCATRQATPGASASIQAIKRWRTRRLGLFVKRFYEQTGLGIDAFLHTHDISSPPIETIS